MSTSFDLEQPDHFVPGVIGEPGSRVFYLQAREGTELVSLRLEKQQIAALCEYLAGILADLPAIEGDPPTELDLIQPVLPEWLVGALAVAYDDTHDRVLVVAEELSPEPEEGEDPPSAPAASARFRITREQVTAFIVQGTRLIHSGRPPCPLCGHPINPEGHVCPRSNGHGTG